MAFIDKHQEKCRLGVIGAGKMGLFHLRAFRRLAGVDVVGFYDPDDNRSHLVSEEGFVRFGSVDDLLFEIDGVVVASPTASHMFNAQRALRAGVHVLVEKPFCGDVDQARRVVELAEELNLIVQVGFVERHRVIANYPFLRTPELSYASFQRHSSKPNREPEINVLWDLMIHDIDLALWMAGIASGVLDARGGALVSPSLDYGRCRLRFYSGLEVDFFCSRVSSFDIRAIYGLCGDRSFRIDLLSDPKAASVDALVIQAGHFIGAIRAGTIEAFSGKEALNVLNILADIHRVLDSKASSVSLARSAEVGITLGGL